MCEWVELVGPAAFYALGTGRDDESGMAHDAQFPSRHDEVMTRATHASIRRNHMTRFHVPVPLLMMSSRRSGNVWRRCHMTDGERCFYNISTWTAADMIQMYSMINIQVL